jgi:hypothetical protein
VIVGCMKDWVFLADTFCKLQTTLKNQW